MPDSPRNRRLRVRHVTIHDYDAPVGWGLLQLRLRPKAHPGQRVLDWRVSVEGGRQELAFEDHHRNAVDLVNLHGGATRVVVACEGEVEVEDRAGVLGAHGGFAPLWLFGRATPRTEPGPGVRRILRALPKAAGVERLHALMAAVADAMAYEVGSSSVAGTAEDALAAGRGVCQDQAHAFVACARALGVPARYVSGYLLMEDREAQDATHAWAEAWVEGLGWVGFDVANRMSPDARYVRVATGLDYAEAAPVSGLRGGPGGERLSVSVEVRPL